MDVTPVTLAEMLDARERRAARQLAALVLGLPVVSLSVVMPGPVKDGAPSRAIFLAATAALDRLFGERQWPVRRCETVTAATGPEALYVVDVDALALKQALVELEESHALGRLWDLDVIRPGRGILSRRALGLAPRRCLACESEAHACARSQRHSLDQLLTIIAEMVDA